LLYLSKVTNFKQITTTHGLLPLRLYTVALPLKGNEFQANHNASWRYDHSRDTVALPLKGNEFQANHNTGKARAEVRVTVALPLKGNEFQANHNPPNTITSYPRLLLYLSKVTNFKQITTDKIGYAPIRYCCFTSQR